MPIEIDVLDGGSYQGVAGNPYVMPYTDPHLYDYIVVAAPRYQDGAVTLSLGGVAVPLTAHSANTGSIIAELSLFVYDVAAGAAPSTGNLVLTQDVSSANLGMNVYGIRGAEGFSVATADSGGSGGLPPALPVPPDSAALQCISARDDGTSRSTNQGFLTHWTANGPAPDRQVYAVFAPQGATDGQIVWSGLNMYWASAAVTFTPPEEASRPYQGWPRGGNIYAPLEA